MADRSGVSGGGPARLPEGTTVLVPALGSHPADRVVGDFIDLLTEWGARPVRTPRPAAAMAKLRIRGPGRGAPVVVPMMGARFDLLFGAGLIGSPVPFAWDVWSPGWPHWVDRLARVRPRLMFVTAQESAEHLASRLSGTRVVNVPEAIHVARYDGSRPLRERSIDVLELGRRDPAWHDRVTPALAGIGARHRFEDGGLVFPDAASMRAGLADSRVSVCFTSATTTPARSGAVRTMTQRYLESLASGCLVVGEPVPELTGLLGWDPVVAADPDRPERQVRELLEGIDEHQGRVTAARDAVAVVGDWEARRELMAECLMAAFPTASEAE